MQEIRKFQISTNMIFHTIHSQAGSIQKAILECLMNAVDAGATKVEVNLNDDGIHYEIKDNGKGFSTKKEILDCFEVFGFDHGTPEENKRTYGTFGIGRAQLWGFSKNKWFTNNFTLDVDIKNKGLDYELAVTKDHVKGCHIQGVFYEKKKMSELQEIAKELKKLALYLPIDFYLDGNIVNKKVEEMKWDEETENAYMKFNETGDLNIYNKGVFVCTYSNRKFGKGGTIIAKKALTLNTARNDILLAQCTVWKNIKKHVEVKATRENLKKDIFSKAQAQSLISQVLSNDVDFYEIKDKKIFPDVKGKLQSLSTIISYRKITICPTKGSQVGETIQNNKVAFVFSQDIVDWTGLTENQLFDNIVGYLKNSNAYQRGISSLVYVPYSELAESFKSDYKLVENKDLSKKELVYLDVMTRIAERAFRMTEYHIGRTVDYSKLRKIRIGETELSTNAWTDGKTFIAFRRDLVNTEMRKGLNGAIKLVGLMVHEYLHDEPSNSTSHVHSFDFYENFHEIILHDPEFPVLQKDLVKKLAISLKAKGLSLPVTYRKDEEILEEATA